MATGEFYQPCVDVVTPNSLAQVPPFAPETAIVKQYITKQFYKDASCNASFLIRTESTFLNGTDCQAQPKCVAADTAGEYITQTCGAIPDRYLGGFTTTNYGDPTLCSSDTPQNVFWYKTDECKVVGMFATKYQCSGSVLTRLTYDSSNCLGTPSLSTSYYANHCKYSIVDREIDA